MTRSIDNIDLYTFIYYRHILRKNGDTSLPLDVIVIQYQLAEILRLTDKIGLINHPVHEGSFSVVNVRDNRDVPYIHITFPIKQPAKLLISSV